MVTTMPITKARINLGSVVKKLRINKGYVVLEKDGYPVVGMMDIDEFEDYLELHNPRIQREIKASADDYRKGNFRPARELLKELKAKSKHV